MMLIIKIFILQALWFIVALYASHVTIAYAALSAFIFLLLDYCVFKPTVGIYKYISLSLFFVLYGFLSDSLLLSLDVIGEESYSYNYLLLWVFFIGYYDVIFKKFTSFKLLTLSAIGGVGGAFAYLSASRLDAFSILPGQIIPLIIISFLSWAVFFPLTIRIYHMKSLKDFILDKLIITSFDSSGFKRHQKSFNDHPDFTKVSFEEKFSSKKALVTGGTSGIGECVFSILDSLGVNVDFVGRNEDKGRELERKYPNSHFIKMDISEWDNIDKKEVEANFYDYVVLNAGAMPDEKVLNEDGVELQCASQLIGHYKLINKLRRNKQISDKTRIVWVSSGGMYLKKLDVANLFNPVEYDKVDTYANVKRAQVTFVEELVKLQSWKDFSIYSMHPGWVGTPGLKDALPKFYNLFSKRLRSAHQGADTIVWLLITKQDPESGGFFFDRSKVAPYFLKSYDPTDSQRKSLMDGLGRYVKLM